MNLLRNAVLASAVLATALSAQNPCFDTNIGTDINAADDTLNPGHALGFTFNFAGVGYTDIVIDPNGCIYFGATTTAFSDFSPSEAEFLASASPRIGACQPE